MDGRVNKAPHSQQHSKRPSSQSGCAASKRKNDVMQTSLSFKAKEKYPIGMKVLLDESIYPTAASVSWFVIVDCCVAIVLADHMISPLPILAIVLQVPAQARGKLFEYELIQMCRLGATVRYNDLIYKPGAYSLESFKKRVVRCRR